MLPVADSRGLGVDLKPGKTMIHMLASVEHSITRGGRVVGEETVGWGWGGRRKTPPGEDARS